MKKVLLSTIIALSLTSPVFAQQTPQPQQKVSTSWEVIPGQEAANLIVTDADTKKVVSIKVFTKADLVTAKGQEDAHYQQDVAFLDSGIKLIDASVAPKAKK